MRLVVEFRIGRSASSPAEMPSTSSSAARSSAGRGSGSSRAAGCDTRTPVRPTSARTIPDRVAIVAAGAASRPVSASSQTAPTVAWTHISISCSGTQNRKRKSAGDPAGGDSTKPLSCPEERASSRIAEPVQPSASSTIGAGLPPRGPSANTLTVLTSSTGTSSFPG